MKFKGLTKEDLGFVNWTISDIKKIPAAYKKHKAEEFKKIKSIKPEDRTFENTVIALQYSDGIFAQKGMQVHVLGHLEVDDKKRNTCFDIESEIKKISIEFSRDQGIYRSLVEYKNLGISLEGEDEKLLTDYLKSFERMGFSLPSKKQTELLKIDKKISELLKKFAQNIANYKDSITISEEETGGLDKSFLDTLNKNKKGDYVVSLDTPEFVPFVVNSNLAEKRKEIVAKDSKRGGFANIKIVKDVLDLRNKRAKILGYKTHADYVLEDRMSQETGVVKKFLDSIESKVYSGAKKNISDLLKRKIADTGRKNDKLSQHDIAYYKEKIEKEVNNLDTEKIMDYLPLNHVLNEMFAIFGEVLGIEFKKKRFKLWHKEAMAYALVDVKTKVEIGYILMDFFPRRGKYGHACATPLRMGHQDQKRKDEYVTPATVFICNFRKPTKSKPSLLTPHDVVIMFHEFGHAVHNSIARSRHIDQSGFNVNHDFVELPSQLSENWVYNEKTLKRISKHYKTGKKLPAGYINSIIKSKTFMRYFFVLRQVSISKFDIDIHSKKIKEPHLHWAKIVKDITGVSIPKESLFPASLVHFDDYDAGYYSYLWSLVYADDVFSEFKKHGIFSKKIGKKYREEILEVGGSRDEMDSLKAFLGRKPNDKAFIKNILCK